MYKAVLSCFKLFFRLLALALLGCVLLVLRYIFRTPQPLKSALPGEARLYKWTYGQVYYQVAGPRDAPVLVLVHAPGVGASSHEMHGIMNDLAQSYRVYALDLLGFGLSDHPSINYTAEIYVSLLHDFLVSVVGQSATLLARGLSCQYCAVVAATDPDLCNGLVFLSPPSLSMQLRQQNFFTFVASLPFFDLALYSLLTTRWLWPAPVEKQQQEKERDLAYRFAVAHQLNAHRAGLAYLAGKLEVVGSMVRSTTVTQPVLELWGTRRLQEEQIHTLQEFASSRTQIVLLHDVGPSVLEEQPQVVVRHMLAWKGEQDTQDVEREKQTEPLVGRGMPETVAIQSTTKRTTTAQELTAEPAAETVEAYCVKCKQKRTMQNSRPIVTKKGRNALEGNCSACGTRLFRFISSQ